MPNGREQLQLKGQLFLDRCPHCGTAKPCLTRSWGESRTVNGVTRPWVVYWCSSCGGSILATGHSDNGPVTEFWPPGQSVDDAIPDRPRQFLQQAIDSLHAPAGAVMLAASSVDAMLKAKGLTTGNLYSRIDKASADHLITSEMGVWAHEIRLDANDQRHADENAPLPNETDARRVIAFAQALGQFLFVLPAQVAHGRSAGDQPK